MNENKICFIYCINDEEQYEKSLHYIKQLNVPPSIEIESISIEGAQGMAAGYNYAMSRTDAKYKVYLHQDVYILNTNFILDIVNLFKKHSGLGLLGVVGSKNTPENGIWWDNDQKFGKVYDSHSGSMSLLNFSEINGEFESVTAIDGLIMVTQYDILWREDLFKGWHFYDLSHCAEIIKAGYQVGIPKQKDPWCIHDCGLVNIENGFEEAKNIFVKTYINGTDQSLSKDEEVNSNIEQNTSHIIFTKNNIIIPQSVYVKEYPLVSILIPAYNRPYFLELALNSVLNQTYKHIEIIICDDSTNNEVQTMITPFLKNYPQIKYCKNDKSLFLDNWHKCYELASGEFINYLMDDDVFHEQKIEKMMAYYLEYEDITLVTSFRQLIDLQGNFLPPIKPTRCLFNETKILDGKFLGNYVLRYGLNVVGEGTTVLFRKRDLTEKFGNYKGKQYCGINDVVTWMSLFAKGKAVYIPEALSYFRLHPNQNSSSKSIVSTGLYEWLDLIFDSREDGFLENRDLLKAALHHQRHNIIQLCLSNNRALQPKKQEVLDRILDLFLEDIQM